MKLIPITKPMPEIIWEVYELVKETMKKLKHFDPAKDIVIGGGALSNSYMGKPMTDIDVFVQFHEEDLDSYPTIFKNAFGNVEMITIEKGDSYSSLECPMLYRFDYKGVPIEIVFNMDIGRVFDFDIRLRQFYLMDNEIVASEKALEDIENGVLVLASPFSPLRTLVRLYQFKDQLNLTIDQESLDVVLSLLGGETIDYSYFEHVLDTRKKISATARKELENFLLQYKHDDHVTFPEHPFPYDASVFDLFKGISQSGGISRNMFSRKMGHVGTMFEKIKAYMPKEETEVDAFATVNWTKHPDVIKDFFATLKPLIAKDRLSMVFDTRRVQYNSAKPLDEQKAKALEQIQALKKALELSEEKIDTVFQQEEKDYTTSYIQPKADWFRSVQSIFNRNCDHYNPIETNILEAESYKEVYSRLYELAYKEKDFERLVEEFIYGEEKNRNLLIDLINVYLYADCEYNGHYILNQLFQTGQKIYVKSSDSLSMISLKEQMDEGYRLFTCEFSNHSFNFLVKEEEDGNHSFVLPDCEEDFWINELLFNYVKVEFKNLRPISEVEDEEEEVTESQNFDFFGLPF